MEGKAAEVNQVTIAIQCHRNNNPQKTKVRMDHNSNPQTINKIPTPNKHPNLYNRDTSPMRSKVR